MYTPTLTSIHNTQHTIHHTHNTTHTQCNTRTDSTALHKAHRMYHCTEHSTHNRIHAHITQNTPRTGHDPTYHAHNIPCTTYAKPHVHTAFLTCTFVVWFRDRVACSPDWTGDCYVIKYDLELQILLLRPPRKYLGYFLLTRASSIVQPVTHLPLPHTRNTL